MDNGYEQVPIGPDRVRFTVHPAAVPRSRYGPIALGVLVGVIVVAGSGGPAAAPLALRLVGGVLAFGASWGIAHGLRRHAHARHETLRAPGGTFVASGDGIDRAGSRLAPEELRALTVRNLLLAPRRRGQPSRKFLPSSWALCAGPAERPTVIAGGMSEAVARGLLDDVRRILEGGRIRTGGAS